MAVKKKVKTKKLKKTIHSVSSDIGLVLEGCVYLVEKDSTGKIVSKIALDNEAVLKALSYVLYQSKKARP